MHRTLAHRFIMACAASGALGCEFIAGNDKLGEPIPIQREPDASDGIDAGGDDGGVALDGSTDAQADAGGMSCTSNQDCRDFAGEYSVCRRTDGACVSLISEHCNEVIGEYQNDDALLLGSIGPTTGSNKSTGLSNLWGIKLALQDFTVVGNGGLPPTESSGRRPIVVVHCDDGANSDQAVEGARHLTEDLGVSAIIGPSFSGITTAVASKVTIPAGVLLISPSATSASITALIDNDLVWRTAPSDVVQANAQALLAAQVGEKIRELQRIMENNPLKLMILHKGDSYGSGLAEDTARSLIWNKASAIGDPNAPFVKRFDYGDPGNPVAYPIHYDEALAKTLELLPHVVLLYGTAEVAELIEMLETSWPEDGPQPRPHYVFADGGHTVELSDKIFELDPEGVSKLADRVFGTEPGFLGSNYELFQQLYVSKAEAPPPITFGSANAYDALYVLAYASVIAGKTHPTGNELATAIARLVPSEGIPLTDVGATRINGTLKELTTGAGRIDLSGASGPLDFDLKTGDVASGILVWCTRVDTDGSVKFIPTLETYDPVLNQIVLVREQAAPCGHSIAEEPPPEEELPPE